MTLAAVGGLASTGGNGGTTGGFIATGGASASGGTGPCDPSVHPPASIQVAIDASPTPGTVCIEPGLYNESITLRDGVDLQGTAPGANICGSITADAATVRGVRVSAVAVLRGIKAVGSVRIQLSDVDVAQPGIAGCSPTENYSVDISRSGGNGILLQATRVKVAPWGFVLRLANDGTPAVDRIAITQSRCQGFGQCWSLLDLEGSSSAEPFATGSRLTLEFANNLIENVVLEGITLEGYLNYAPQDAQQSQIMLRHNTVISRGDPNYGFALRGDTNVPVILANNAVSYLGNPVLHYQGVPLVTSGNMTSSDAASKLWFESFDTGDYRPSVDSPLATAADANFGVPIDIDGRPRQEHYDVGAYQR